MFRFARRRSKADAAVAALPEAIDRAARKRAYFHDTLAFKPDVSLVQQIQMFLIPFEQGVNNDIPAVKNPPSGIMLLMS